MMNASDILLRIIKPQTFHYISWSLASFILLLAKGLQNLKLEGTKFLTNLCTYVGHEEKYNFWNYWTDSLDILTTYSSHP